MALILSARRGWLPQGFTELEYLESSGTQCIYFETGKTWERTWGYKASCELSAPGATSQVFLSSLPGNDRGVSIGYNPYVTPHTIVCGGFTSSLNVVFEESKRYDCELNFFNSSELKINAERKTWNPAWSLYGEFWDVILMGWYNHREDGTPYFTPAAGQMKLFNFAITIENDLFFDMVPVLDASGIPCMFDKVSKTCFYNSGTGTFGYRVKTTDAESAPFSLRDPYYTAPSGVYARLIAENELEILADTEETTGDGWEWFANTGEAYEHFGITQEELLTE